MTGGGKWAQLDRFIDEFMTPVMVESGFRRRGRSFRLESAEGSVVIVDVKGFTPVPHLSFHVNWGVVPRPLRDHFSGGDDRRVPSASWALISSRMIVPEPMRFLPPVREMFDFDVTTDDGSYGRDFRDTLLFDAIPVWRNSLDRRFLADQPWDGKPYINMSTWSDPALRRAILFVDDGDPSEVANLLDKAQSSTRNDARDLAMISWLRDRLAARLTQA